MGVATHSRWTRTIRRTADEHLARHPELERYGEAVRAWCIHDNQHDAQLHWLANVLAARGG